MAANFIELQEEEVSNEALTDLNQQGSTIPEPTEQAVDNTEEIANQVEVPEKYKGKSLEEVVRMHQESEKLIGRQAQEVGESRKLLDQYIKQQLEQKHDTQQPSKAQEIDWFEDPAKAVNQAVENNPLLKQLQEQQAQQAQVVAQQTIEKAHPDYLDVAASEDFAQWVQGSKIRMGLYAKASNFDVDSAMELLETYKSLRNIKTHKAEQTKAADESLKKADEESRSKALKTASVQQGGTGESTKPIYRRADLIRLRMQDPNRYESMADDILNAYAEGRVR
jgi:hypothetical protein